ncbi:MAG TPA: hypothetical protein PK096_01260 [Candidatus Saccharibacteria bacterium]|nr:hypothetical protein [Candidatus Saccharibacteria bacterium]HRK93977.1 hypothetical protein [Candidatus Saccharibacteria bacterium]
MRKQRAGFITAVVLSVVVLANLTSPAQAITGWNAGRIIDDSVFTANKSMSVSQIQSFLNAKVPTCDTNGQQISEHGGPDLNGDGKVQRWEWGKSRYNQTKFICLKDYVQNSKKASQIIYDVSQKYRISPKVMLVLLQKEQSLVTDTWPLNVQYRTATGYGCPDTAPCDSQYYGLTNQLDWAAKMFRAIMDNSPSWYTPYELGNNYIQYNPVASCGGSTVNIQNRATQALYNYTPYQPNKAALNAGWGSASCGAYGNRNFFLYFSSWFGQPNAAAAYGYALSQVEVFSDAAMTQKIGTSTASVRPVTPFYVRILVKNTGNQVWYKEFLRIGTTYPTNRGSEFADATWINPARPGYMKEDTVAAGGTATFEFKMNAPANLGSYVEKFGVLLENQRWMGSSFTLNLTVETPDPYYSVASSQFKFYHDAARKIRIDPANMKYFNQSKMYGTVVITNTGNRLFPAELTRIATTNPRNRASSFVDDSWVNSIRPVALTNDLAPGASAILTFILKAPATGSGVFDEQLGLVIENQRWLTDDIGTAHISVESKGPASLLKDQTLSVGQSLVSPNELYRLDMQSDGNLVLYTAANKPTWHSKTFNSGSTRLDMQSDGNLVLYTAANRYTWYTKTYNSGSTRLDMQSDGNLVLYRTDGRYTWYSNTWGKLSF